MFLRMAFLVFTSLVWARTNGGMDSLSESMRFPSLGSHHPTQPQTVRVEAVQVGGKSVGKFAVSTTAELRKKVADELKVHPLYVDLIRGDVILQDSASYPEFVDGELVHVIEQSKVDLPRIVDSVKALDWEHLKDRKNMKAQYWDFIKEVLTSAFDESDKKCEIVPDKYSGGSSERENPDCLKFKVEMLGSLWNALKELAAVRGFYRSDEAKYVPTFEEMVKHMDSSEFLWTKGLYRGMDEGHVRFVELRYPLLKNANEPFFGERLRIELSASFAGLRFSSPDHRFDIDISGA